MGMTVDPTTDERIQMILGDVRIVLINQEEILQEIKHTNRRLRIMAKTIADLDVELGNLDTDVATLKTDNDALLAKLAALPQSPDLTAQVEHAQKVDALLKAIIASDTPSPDPTPAPTGFTPVPGVLPTP